MFAIRVLHPRRHMVPGQLAMVLAIMPSASGAGALEFASLKRRCE